MAKIRIGLALAVSAGVWAHLAVAQQGRPAVTPLAVVTTVEPELAAGAVFKEIDDPGSGLRWMLVEDPAHLGGPGRLVSLRPGESKALTPKSAARVVKANPVIHAGEAVQVEEHTAVVDASLQAVALDSAIPGGMLRVRLRIGGRVLKARALAVGRAALEPAGDRP
ncbi:MAG: hypothetical protein WCF17_22775 [Terracidiphilus sp.]